MNLQATMETILARYEECAQAMLEPEVMADLPRYQAVLKEHAALEETVQAYRAYLDTKRHLAECLQMQDDPELKAIAAAEAEELTGRIARQEEQLRLLLLPRDPDDERSLVLEIRAGAGGEEAALFASDLARMYIRYAEGCGFSAEVIADSPTELGGTKECVMLIAGRGAYAKFKYESGVHRVQRVPVTDASGKKQTSTCTVAVLPEAEEVDLQIDPKELRIDTYRATGHGGQYINMTDSAVRIVHLPTGVTVTCQDQKSQLKNREQAMKVLRARLLAHQKEQAAQSYAGLRRSQVGTGDRSERIRTYNFHESRVTDHRIGKTVYRIQDVMNGDLGEFVDALTLDEQHRKLQQGEA